MRDGPPIKFKGLAKKVLNKYPLVEEILFVNNNKLKVITKSLTTANNLIQDEEFCSFFKINVPFDLCEVRGVASIPVDYSEKEVYKYTNVKHKPEFCFIDHFNRMSIIEVKRNTRAVSNNDNTKSRVPVNSVVITFPGTILPSHVELDGLIKSFVEPVLQCYKCFRFKHTTKACKKTRMLCRRCSKAHDNLNTACSSPEVCINCKGPHSSLNKNCPHYVKIKKANDEKARQNQPKKAFSSPFSLEAFPALGSRLRVGKKKPYTHDDGPSSLNDPPPNKRFITDSKAENASDSLVLHNENVAGSTLRSSMVLETTKNDNLMILPTQLAIKASQVNQILDANITEIIEKTESNYFNYNILFKYRCAKYSI